jgi:hypothetical protein
MTTRYLPSSSLKTSSKYKTSTALSEISLFFISESSADSYSYSDSNSDSSYDPSSSDFLNSTPLNADDSNDQLADKITTLAGQINAATYRFIKMIAEFDRRKAWVGPGIRSCAYWLPWKSALLFNLKKYCGGREGSGC